MNKIIKNRIKNLYKNKQNKDISNIKNETPIYCIEYMKQIAKERGGKCLSDIYINMTTHLKWQCECGNIWYATPTCVISRGQWCPKCSKKHTGIKRLDWKVIQNAAIKKGGHVVSTEDEYINIYSKLKWQCKYGHIWEACIDTIKNTTKWCPMCNISYGENISRIVFETIFKKSFSSVKPEWLLNPETNKSLELDGYNDELKLAFEYNGIQHYNNSFYTKTRNTLSKQQQRDIIKNKICNEKGIKLITIPYIIDNEEIKNYIIIELKKLGYDIDENVKIDKSKVYRINKHKEFEKKVNALGYELMSSYNGYLNPVTLKCKKGHVFDILARSVNRNKGCPVCRGYRVQTTEDIKKKCLDIGLKMLDDKYIPGQRINTECLNCGKRLKLRHADLNKHVCKCRVLKNGS
jgi:hypothetical protein